MPPEDRLVGRGRLPDGPCVHAIVEKQNQRRRNGRPDKHEDACRGEISGREWQAVLIHTFFGKTPIMCFGKLDGDLQMLEPTTIRRTPSFGLIVYHTDEEREYAYDEKPKSNGKLVEALA